MIPALPHVSQGPLAPLAEGETRSYYYSRKTACSRLRGKRHYGRMTLPVFYIGRKQDDGVLVPITTMSFPDVQNLKTRDLHCWRNTRIDIIAAVTREKLKEYKQSYLDYTSVVQFIDAFEAGKIKLPSARLKPADTQPK
jgi:hypothetical protein